jgi:hypothetical protein
LVGLTLGRNPLHVMHLLTSQFKLLTMKTIIFCICILLFALKSPAQEAPANNTAPLATPQITPPVSPSPQVSETPIKVDKPKVIQKISKTKKEALTTDEVPKKEEPTKNEAEDKKYDFLSNIDYPELQVVPKASERLLNEAQSEDDAPYLMFWPIELSALATFYAGTVSKGTYKEDNPTTVQKNNSDSAALIAQSAGVAWLAIPLFIAYKKPYVDAYNRIKKVKPGNKRADLFRERIAEEEMEKIHDIAKKLSWLSAGTQFIASAAVMDRTAAKNEKWAAMAIAASVMPLIFETRYVKNWEKHQEYKRKIYSPVAQLGLGQDTKMKTSYYPEFQLTWRF